MKFKVNSRSVEQMLKQLGEMPNEAMKDTYNVYKKNTPIKTGNARSKTNVKNTSKGFEVTGNYPYGGVINEGGYPNPPKAGTGKTSGGFSTQAPKGITKPTIEFIEKEVKQYIRKHA